MKKLSKEEFKEKYIQQKLKDYKRAEIKYFALEAEIEKIQENCEHINVVSSGYGTVKCTICEKKFVVVS